MFKKLKLLFLYIKILNKNKQILKTNHNISIDWVYRMYKTYNITEKNLEDIKTFGDKYFTNIIKKEISDIEGTFINIGLNELVTVLEVVELNEKQIGMAFKFKFLNTTKLFGRLLWSFLYTISGLFGFLLSGYIGLGIGLLSILILYLITRIF